MQNPTARVVLAACLAAAAAAQGTSAGLSLVPRELPTLTALQLQPEAGLAAARATSADADAPMPSSFGLEGFGRGSLGQDPQDRYQPGRLFQDVHGDFMRRMDRYRPNMEFGGRWLPNQSLQREPGHYNQYVAYGDLSYRWNTWADGYILLGAFYEGREYQFEDMGNRGGGTELDDEYLTQAGLNIGFGQFLDDNTLLEVRGRPGVYSDLDGGLHRQDYDYPSRAMLTYRATDGFFIKGGVRYSQVFQDALWLPLIGFSWDLNDTFGVKDKTGGGWRLDVLLPEYVEMSFWPNSAIGILLGCEITGAQYAVRDSLERGKDRDYLFVQEIVAYGGLNVRMTDNFSARGRAGMVLAGDTFLTNGTANDSFAQGALTQGFWCEFSFGIDF
ncbi:MAG: hypothetical protein JNK49_02335 [Planctomycetes bacterium]|nr:hypothetical protein [Planctomycetota bacterium]